MEGAFVQKTLDVPSLEEVKLIWEKACKENFDEVSVNVVDQCPDLRAWGLACSGIGGNVEVVDVGSPLNVERKDRRNHKYSVDDIAARIHRPGAFFWGAGATAAEVCGQNAEWMPNMHLATCPKGNNSHFTYLDSDMRYHSSAKYDSLRFDNLCNFGVSDGHRHGPVLHVSCQRRVGTLNFVECLSSSLSSSSLHSRQVSVAGVFRVHRGKVRAHVMPDFPDCDLDTKELVDGWLKFFEMPAPLTCLSVFHSKDQYGLGLRMQHTHFFSDDDRGGHYHYDTTPDEVHYEGYFVLAEKITKI